ncbi:MAG: flagellar FlbD family protein [Silvanigrellaceae bacterium]
MIEVTKLDGSKLFVNEMNIQWIESLPDTAITFLGGARVIVRDTQMQ